MNRKPSRLSMIQSSCLLKGLQMLNTFWNQKGFYLASCLIGFVLLAVTVSYATIVWGGIVWSAQDILLPIGTGYFDLLAAHPYLTLGATFLGIIFLGGLMREMVQKIQSSS